MTLGQKLNRHGQSIEVLSILLEHPGELFTREEFCQRVWMQDTFVDFEHSLNTAIKKLRQVFADDPDATRYIETLSKKGYRFIDAVETRENAAAARENERQAPVRSPLSPTPRWWGKIIAAAVVIAITGGTLDWIYRPHTPIVTAIHQLTRTGHQKVRSSLVNDGTKVYCGEWFYGKTHLAQVSTAGGEVAYIDAPLIQNPFVEDFSNDGSELLVADVSFTSMDVFSWIVPLPGVPARRIPGKV